MERQEPEAAGHIVSMESLNTLVNPSLVYPGWGLPSHGPMPPTFKDGLLASINPTEEMLQRHAQWLPQSRWSLTGMLSGYPSPDGLSRACPVVTPIQMVSHGHAQWLPKSRWFLTGMLSG